ncbi:MAG: hypothetical protein H8E13_05470 [Actinobacteria bacterium]|nr:hypothetical protein [Actinomycetota bacterium]
MGKNKLYIFLSILTITFLFGTAAICTQCGANIDKAVGDLGGSVDEEPPGTEPGVKQPSSTEPGETPSGDEPPYEDNHPPAIEEIETMGVDVEYAEAEGMFEDLPADPDMEGTMFSIEAYDEDGDELRYRVYDSLGAEFDVTKIDNNNAEFYWELSEEPGPYTLTIEVSDGRGGTDSQLVNMTFSEPDEGADEDPVDFGEVVNSPPEIHGAIIIENLSGSDSPEGGPYNCGIHYRISVNATDVDGDPLTYRWWAGRGRIIDENANPSSWEAPDSPLSCIIRVYVSDGINEEITTAITVEVE